MKLNRNKRKTKFNLRDRIFFAPWGIRKLGISHLKHEVETRDDAKASGYDVKLRSPRSPGPDEDRIIGQGEFGPYHRAFPRKDNKGHIDEDR